MNIDYQQNNTEIKKKIINSFKKKFIIYKFGFYFFSFLCILLIVLSAYFAYTNPLINIKIPFIYDRATELERENERIIKHVSTLIDLPDEEPIVTDILTREMIESQPFFEKAEIGDKLIIFYNSKRAILYSPDQKIIKELANIKTADPDLPREMLGI